MNRRNRILALAFASLASGCFVVTDLDRFHATPAALEVPFQDLNLTIKGLVTHVNHRFEYRVIDANNFVQSRGVLEPTGAVDVTIHVPQAVPRVNGPYRLDFFADKNHSGGWDGLTEAVDHDHGWRVEPLVNSAGGDPNNGVIEITYVHNTSFTELNNFPTSPTGAPNPPRDTGSSATIHFAGMQDYMGKLVQVRVAEMPSGHIAGLYRVPIILKPDFDGIIPGIIDPGVEYRIDVYADANGNGAYDNPAAGAGDHGFRLPAPSDAKGLNFAFNPKTFPERSVDVGAP